MPPYEALYDWPRRSPLYWDEGGEQRLIRSENLQDCKEKVALIQKRLKTAQDRQKSYDDRHRTRREFKAGDHVFLKIRPLKEVLKSNI